MQDSSIGFIGGGHMASSLISGLLASGFPATQLSVYDRNIEKTKQLQIQWGILASPSLKEILKISKVLVLAVKPQDMKDLLAKLRTEMLAMPESKPLIISIAAGISTHQLERGLGENLAIIRAMPNTPALLRVGASGLYANARTQDDQKELAESILRSVGLVVWLNHEHDIDTITAISGSGPAYFFLVMQILQQTGEQLGLPKTTAKILSLQTALGAARMAMESDISLNELLHKVASPGGTTETALQILDSGQIQELFKKAITAAKQRAKEISEAFEKP